MNQNFPLGFIELLSTPDKELKKRKQTIYISESYYALNTFADQGIHQALKNTDQREYIQRAMAQIKVDEALILRLFYLCEMSLKEVEEITKFSASKIRVDLHRGRKNLRQELQKLLGKHIDDLL